MEPETRMQTLVQQLNEASRLYYATGNSPLSDAQWDRLYDELRRLETETGQQLPDSPTARVGTASSSMLAALISACTSASVTETSLQTMLCTRSYVLFST